MIHENGKLQVIDFGVAGVLQTKLDKRTTVIGTPHWMAPELHKPAGREGLNYGAEVSFPVLMPNDLVVRVNHLIDRYRLMFGRMVARCMRLPQDTHRTQE